MSTAWLKPQLNAGYPLVGTFIQSPHVGIAEFLATLPLDFVCLEAEHSPFDGETMRHIAAVCDLHRMPLMVRPPEAESVYCAQALDAGASGILAPRVNSADEADLVASACCYPPTGSRGVGPGRASGYGADIVGHLEEARDNTLVAIQIETASGIENLDGILSVAGIDLVFVGPGDLAVALTGNADPAAARVRATITAVLEKSKAAKRMTGIFANTPEIAVDYANEGVDLIILGSDLVFLARGVETFLATYHDALSAYDANGKSTFDVSDLE